MKKILILYFSGAGATKKIAGLIYTELLPDCQPDIAAMENSNVPDPGNYDALVVGMPVYHTAPPKIVMKFWDSVSPLPKQTPVFIYNTRALYALNTNRILSKKLRHKNIITVMSREYRGPASDGSIIAPGIRRFFEFEKDIEQKVRYDCQTFLKLIRQDVLPEYRPPFRLGSIFNAPNKLAGQLITFKIHLHKDKCRQCGHCIKHCPHTAFSAGPDGYPLYSPANCENCYRCIHHCQSNALSLSKHRTPKKRLQF